MHRGSTKRIVTISAVALLVGGNAGAADPAPPWNWGAATESGPSSPPTLRKAIEAPAKQSAAPEKVEKKGALPSSVAKLAVAGLGKDVWVGFWAYESHKFGKKVFLYGTGAAITNPGAQTETVSCLFLDREGNPLRQELGYFSPTTSLKPGQRWECHPPQQLGGIAGYLESQKETELPEGMSDNRGTVVITSTGTVLPTAILGRPGFPKAVPGEFYPVDCGKPGKFAFACKTANPPKEEPAVVK